MAKRRKNNVRNPSENVRLEGEIKGGIGVLGGNVKGASDWREINVEEYEKRLASMRKAKEDIPNLPLNDEFLKDAGLVYDRLSDQGRRNLNFLLTGKEEILTKRYPPDIDAIWIRPYVEELMMEYERIVTSEGVEKQKIPFFQFSPIGTIIVLSQFKGAAVIFRKKMPGLFYTTCERPILENFIIKDAPKIALGDGATYRARIDDPTADSIWLLLFGSEERQYFSIERAKSAAQLFAMEDIAFFRAK